MPTVEDLGKAVKAKYPGAYDDMPDGDLGVRIQKKYPGAYDDYDPVAPTVGPPKALVKIQKKMATDTADQELGWRLWDGKPGTIPTGSMGTPFMATPLMKGTAAISEGTGPDIARGAHMFINAAAEGMAPIAIPVGLAEAPAATIAGLGAGTWAQKLARARLEKAGVRPEYQDIGGDVAGLAAGAGAARLAPSVASGIDVAADTVGNLVKNAAAKSTVIKALKDAHAQATGKAPVAPPRTAPIPAVKYRASAPEAPAAPIPAVSYRPQAPSAPVPTPPPVSYRPAPAEAPVAAIPPVNYKPTPTPEAGPTAPPPPLKPMNRSVAAEPTTPAPAPTSTVARAPRPSDEYYKVHAQVKKAMTSSQELFKQGITAKQLSELAPEERAKALGKNSEETFNRILFELRGLETGKVKSQ